MQLDPAGRRRPAGSSCSGHRGAGAGAASLSASARTEPKRARLDGAVAPVGGAASRASSRPSSSRPTGSSSSRAARPRGGRTSTARSAASTRPAPTCRSTTRAAVGQRNAALRRVARRRLGARRARAVDGPGRAISARCSSAARRDVVELLAAWASPSARASSACRTSRSATTPSHRRSRVLEERLARDIERGTTGAGPHLDEIIDPLPATATSAPSARRESSASPCSRCSSPRRS